MIRERQIEILNLVKLGKANKQIASELFIAESTVKNHIRAIMVGLRADNKAHAVYIALRDGIIGFADSVS